MLNIDGEDDPQITRISKKRAHTNSGADAVWP
jgi:hypothetical protein